MTTLRSGDFVVFMKVLLRKAAMRLGLDLLPTTERGKTPVRIGMDYSLWQAEAANLQAGPESAYPLPLAMQRFTARLVLLLVAMSTCEPFLQTLYGAQPHACCLRRLHARQDGRPQFGQVETRSGNCCPPLTTPRTASAAAFDGSTVHLQASRLSVALPNSFYATRYSSNHSSRAPPDSPNA